MTFLSRSWRSESSLFLIRGGSGCVGTGDEALLEGEYALSDTGLALLFFWLGCFLGDRRTAGPLGLGSGRMGALGRFF